MKKISIKKGKKEIAKSVPYMIGSEKGWGLMFSKKGKALLVADWEGKWISSIHTFFCAPLFVAWINSNKKVVDVKKTKPWRFYLPKKPAKFVFETTEMKTDLKEGDKITFDSIK